MNNKMKYVNEAMSSDESVTIKYVQKLEEIMKKYLDRKCL